MHACQVAGRDIVLCHVKGVVYALDDFCTHALTRMSEGRLRGVRLICPMHGAAFDVRNGSVLSAPATQPLTTHAVRIVSGAIEVAINDQVTGNRSST
jgi:3-phenylpropionate/trans-cinnamate dioxygenase ferredoxin subunit